MKTYNLYHRVPGATCWTQRADEEGDNYPELYADSAETLEELEERLLQQWHDGFVSRYPTSGELVAVEYNGFDEVGEVARWSIEELGQVRLDLGDLRSWMARFSTKIGLPRRQGGITAQAAAQAFFWCLGRVEQQMAEQDWGWAKGALRASPQLASALLWSGGDWFQLDTYEAACAMGEHGEQLYWDSWERNSPGLVAHQREQLELAQQLVVRLGHLGLVRPPKLEWAIWPQRAKAPELVAQEVLTFLCQLPVLLDAQGWWQAQIKEGTMRPVFIEALRVGWAKLDERHRVELAQLDLFSSFKI